MKIILLILLFSQFHLISNSQSKYDTEKWLSYNLNKYFDGDEYGITIWLYKAKMLAKEKGSFDWGVRQYSFEGKNLIIRVTWYKIIDTSMNINQDIVYTLDLSKLLKIRQETDSGLYSYSTKLIFEFRPNYNGVFPYKKYDEINHKYIKEDNYDYTLGKIEGGDYKEEISSDRFVKAFMRLAELDGADVVKDVY